MNVNIDWSFGADMNSYRCLYAYLHPTRDQILYLGMAGKQSVQERLYGRHKRELLGYLGDRYSIDQVRVMIGHVRVPQGRRLTRALLADVESLLIQRRKPVGNIKSIGSRISRPGLCVWCHGAWPYRDKRYLDS